jgi:hypothetical protein
MENHGMQLLGLGLLGLFLFGLLVLVHGLVLPIWSIVDCAVSRRSGGLKAVLLILMVCTWSVGALLYGLILPTTRALRIAASIGVALLLAFAFVVVPQWFKTATVLQKEEIEAREKETHRMVMEFKPQPLPVAVQVGSFTAVWYHQQGHFRQTALIAAMSTAGPELASARNLDRDVLYIATDPETGQTFGAGNHKFGRIDPQTGKMQVIPSDPAYTKPFYNLRGLAYDPTHKRLIVMCSHGSTFFFAYDPAGQKWEQIGGELHNLPLAGLTYDPARGVFYALGFDDMSEQIREVHRINSAGADIGRFGLAIPIPMPRGSDSPAQIHAAGELLALVLAPMQVAESSRSLDAGAADPRLLFVSPKNGDVYLAAAQQK